MRSFDLKLIMIEKYDGFSPRVAMQRRVHRTGCLVFGFRLFGFLAFWEVDGKSLPVNATVL